MTLRKHAYLIHYGLALLILLHIYSLWVTRHHWLDNYYDFGHFYASAILVREGRSTSLYNKQIQNDLQRPMFDEMAIGPMVYNHLPYETLVWIPLTWLDYRAAKLAWFIINILLLAILTIFDRRLLFLALAFYPVIVALKMGQDSILLLTLYVVSYALKDRQHWSGLILSLGLFKPHLVIPFVLIQALRKQWEFVLGFLAGAVALGIASLLMVGFNGMIEFIGLILNQGGNSAQHHIYPSFFANLRGLLHVALGPFLPPPVIFLIVAGLSLGVIWAASKRHNVSLHIAATVLVSYHLYAHDLSILILPICLLNLDDVKPIIPMSILFLIPLYLYLQSVGLVALMAIPLLWYAAELYRKREIATSTAA